MVEKLVNSGVNALNVDTEDNFFGTLTFGGHALLCQGTLTMMCQNKAKRRPFFLFNDILVYGNTQHKIPLEDVKLENVEDDGILKNGWLIRTPAKSFAVYAATATEKAEWMAIINKSVAALLKKTGKEPSSEHAAVWIVDSKVSICMHCKRTQFTVFNRRHHCRKCGAVVCNSCSSRKFLLPAQSSKPLRVCLSCYDTLSTLSHADVGKTPLKIGEKCNYQDSSDNDDSEDETVYVAKDTTSVALDDKPTFSRNSAVNEELSFVITSAGQSVVTDSGTVSECQQSDSGTVSESQLSDSGTPAESQP